MVRFAVGHSILSLLSVKVLILVEASGIINLYESSCCNKLKMCLRFERYVYTFLVVFVKGFLPNTYYYLLIGKHHITKPFQGLPSSRRVALQEKSDTFPGN